MSFYQKITAVGLKFFSKGSLFKHGFNYSPMYRRTTGRITYAADDLLEIRMKLPINWKKNDPPPSTHWTGTIVDYSYGKGKDLAVSALYVSPCGLSDHRLLVTDWKWSAKESSVTVQEKEN